MRDLYEKGKNLNNLKVFLVVQIQRANTSRVLSFKNRVTFLQYYWETMKIDMSKILLSDERDFETAKAVSIKVFAVPVDIRDEFISVYCELCRQIFIYKFIQWRI